MNDKFYEQKKEKQDLMINGAMEIFAKYGYKRASTDDMVKVSGVSKGLWFHYFDNKMGLYSFVVSYGLKYAALELNMHISETSNDLFDNLVKIEAVKLSLMDKYPSLPLLLISVRDEDDADALELVGDAYKQFEEELEKLYMTNEPNNIRLKNMLLAIFERNLKDYYKEPVFRKKAYMQEVTEYVEYAKSLIL